MQHGNDPPLIKKDPYQTSRTANQRSMKRGKSTGRDRNVVFNLQGVEIVSIVARQWLCSLYQVSRRRYCRLWFGSVGKSCRIMPTHRYGGPLARQGFCEMFENYADVSGQRISSLVINAFEKIEMEQLNLVNNISFHHRIHIITL